MYRKETNLDLPNNGKNVDYCGEFGEILYFCDLY